MAHGDAGGPQLRVAHFLQFSFQLLAVVRRAAALNGAVGVLAAGYTVVQLAEHRQGSFSELAFPVESAALGGYQAVGNHPVHAVFAYQRHEALGQLFPGQK